jgi:ABC-type dipeptide/oligopeptide/nickel transport system permease component
MSARLLSALVVMLGVCTLVFLLIHLVPGDPVEAMLGESASPADREALRHALGLDLPVAEQYGRYLAGLLRLDLGQSFFDQRPVVEIVGERLPATLQLAAASLLLALVLALPLGVLAARRRGTGLDGGAMAFSLIGISMPNFWLGPLLILVFSLWLGWTPVSGSERPLSLLLPAITLGTALAAILARMVRASVLEVLGEDYVRTARAKGLSEFAVMRRHALRNAWLPVLTLMGLQLGGLLGGAVITETLFAWPGVGSLLVESIQARDFPVVQGCVLLISLIYVLVNTLTDLAYAWIDPRIGRS